MSIDGYVGRKSGKDLLTDKPIKESNALVGEKKGSTPLNLELQSFAVKVTCFLFRYVAITIVVLKRQLVEGGETKLQVFNSCHQQAS